MEILTLTGRVSAVKSRKMHAKEHSSTAILLSSFVPSKLCPYQTILLCRPSYHNVSAARVVILNDNVNLNFTLS